MTIDPSALGLEEYRELRATIRQRGTVRVAIAVFSLCIWAALAVWGAPDPSTTERFARLVRLVVLAVGFEAVYALHVGVERIGRYLQAYYETVSGIPPAWEHLAAAIGRDRAAAKLRVDPLFSGLFISAAILNLILPLAITGSEISQPSVQLAVSGAFHLFFILRVMQARRISRDQRRRDLEFFETARHS